MSDSTESRWFKIIVFIVAAIVVGVTIANIVFFNRIRDGTCNAVTHGQATTMLWVNVILLVIAVIIFLWSLWRLLFTRETRQRVKHYIVAPAAGAQMGYAYVPPGGPPAAVATSTGLAANVVARGEGQFLATAGQEL